MCVRPSAAALYIPAHTTRPVAEKIAAAGLAYCDHHSLTLAGLAWRPTGAAGLITAGLVGVIIATRLYPELDRAVRRVAGRLVVMRVSERCRRSTVAETIAALVAAGRLDDGVAAELLAADGVEDPSVRPPDLDRRPRRTRRRP